MGGSAPPFATSQLASDGPGDRPFPLIAEWNFGSPTVEFNEPLNAFDTPAPLWFIRYANQSYPVVRSLAAQSSELVHFELEPPDPDPGPDVVSYSPPPNQVTAEADAAPAPAFTDFPLNP